MMALRYFILYLFAATAVNIIMPINLSVADGLYDEDCTERLYRVMSENDNSSAPLPPDTNITGLVIISILITLISTISYVAAFKWGRSNRGKLVSLLVSSLPLLWLLYIDDYKTYSACTSNFDAVLLLTISPVLVMVVPNIVVWLGVLVIRLCGNN